MTWIKTAEGKRLNLNKISTIEATKILLSGYQIVATESAITAYTLLEKPVTKELAEDMMQVLENTLGAQSLEDLAENRGRR